MQLTKDDSNAKYKIKSHQKDQLVISNETDLETHQNSLLLTANILKPWQAKPTPDLTLEDLQPLIDTQPEIIIIGCGEIQAFLTPAVKASIEKKNIGVEVMTNERACETFATLTSENRNVCLGIYME